MKKILTTLGITIAFFTPITAGITFLVNESNQKDMTPTNKVDGTNLGDKNKNVDPKQSAKTTQTIITNNVNNNIDNKQTNFAFSAVKDIPFTKIGNSKSIVIPKNFKITLDEIKEAIKIRNDISENQKPTFQYLSNHEFDTSIVGTYTFSISTNDNSDTVLVNIKVEDEISQFKILYGQNSIKELEDGSIVLKNVDAYYVDKAQKKLKPWFKLPYGITKIEDDTFFHVEEIPDTFTLPNSIKLIGQNVFFKLERLPNTFRLPINIRRINNYAFAGIIHLPNGFIFPKTLTNVEPGVFCFTLSNDQAIFGSNNSPIKTFLSWQNLENNLVKNIALEKGIYVGNKNGSTKNPFPLDATSNEIIKSIREMQDNLPAEVKLNDGISNEPLKGRTYKYFKDMWDILYKEILINKPKFEINNIKNMLNQIVEEVQRYNNDVNRLNNNDQLDFRDIDEIKEWIIHNADRQDRQGYHFSDMSKIEHLYHYGAKFYSTIDFSDGINLRGTWDKIGIRIGGSLLSLKPMSWRHEIPLSVIKNSDLVNDLIIIIAPSIISISLLTS